jgi:phospho-N-acetylmuramoyl-pentapeptide-transferase
MGPLFIKSLSSRRVGQSIRELGPESHLPKAGTPTMGGALILTAILVATLLWANLSNRFVWIVLVVTLAFGVIGFVDDYKKLVVNGSEGLKPSTKFFWQSVVGFSAALVLYMTAENPAVEHALLIPYFPNFIIPLSGVAYVIFTS